MLLKYLKEYLKYITTLTTLTLITLFVITNHMPLLANDDPSLEEKIGQMLIIGFRGNTVTDSSNIIALIKKRHIGGVILFDYDLATKTYGRNITSKAQVTKLIRTLKQASKYPLLVCLDQEGGRVNRLKAKYGFPNFISPDSLGHIHTSYAQNQAEIMANAFTDIGANLNFFPTVDLNTNPSNPVIGKLNRSFSANPDTVISRASFFIDAFHSKQLISTLKHFPGHGSSTKDSHLEFVDITNSWHKNELEPYNHFIKTNRADLIMIGHLFNKNIDNTYPASLSHKTISGLLKNMGFNGATVTDDLQMSAITSKYTIEETVTLAINAGNDLLIFGDNSTQPTPDISEKAFQAILSGVKSKKIPEERIHSAYEQIHRLKLILSKK